MLSGEDQLLLVRGDTGTRGLDKSFNQVERVADLPLLVLDLGLDIIDSVRGFDLEGNCLSSECLHEDLHAVKALIGHDKRWGDPTHLRVG